MSAAAAAAAQEAAANEKAASENNDEKALLNSGEEKEMRPRSVLSHKATTTEFAKASFSPDEWSDRKFKNTTHQLMTEKQRELLRKVSRNRQKATRLSYRFEIRKNLLQVL
jgi:hypothetical protein